VMTPFASFSANSSFAVGMVEDLLTSATVDQYP